MRGRLRPRLGAGELGPSRGALPFTAAENLFDGAIATSRGARRKKLADCKEMGDGGSALLPIYSKRRPTGASHDRR